MNDSGQYNGSIPFLLTSTGSGSNVLVSDFTVERKTDETC